MYILQTTVRLHNTDAAGLLFFAEQFRLAHDAYESFMESIGYAFAPLIRKSDFLLPIVHAEADFLKPLSTGDRLEIQVRAERIGDSSFTLGYTLLRDRTETVGTVRTVHVLINKEDGASLSLLPELRRNLETIAQ